ncbi:hypothetical protein D3C76_1579110 [compost metagenome]
MDRRAHAAHGTTPAMRVAADDSQAEVDTGLNANGRGIQLGDGDVGVFGCIPMYWWRLVTVAKVGPSRPSVQSCRFLTFGPFEDPVRR